MCLLPPHPLQCITDLLPKGDKDVVAEVSANGKSSYIKAIGGVPMFIIPVVVSGDFKGIGQAEDSKLVKNIEDTIRQFQFTRSVGNHKQ